MRGLFYARSDHVDGFCLLRLASQRPIQRLRAVTSLTLNDIRKTYDGDVEVIKGIDLEISDGEFLVLVGPSGCGKSTLLRMIAGLEDITDGTLEIGNEVVNDVEPRDRGLAMVFQSYALYPHMTVRENMGFGLRIRKEDPEVIRKRVEEVAAMLDISPLLERLPKQLSGGQRQRVAIGRAICRKPDVFLFDEPLSNLDAALRTQMRVELKKLHTELRTTMIYVTHDQVEAMTLADRIAVLHLGHLQQAGSPTELFEKPANKFVAGFIGSPSMNFLDVELRDENLVSNDATFPAPAWAREAIEVGIRPQHLELEKPEGLHATLPATLDIIEPMGWEAHLHVQMKDGRHLVAHTEIEALDGLERNDELVLFAELDRLHYFDEAGHALRNE